MQLAVASVKSTAGGAVLAMASAGCLHPRATAPTTAPLAFEFACETVIESELHDASGEPLTPLVLPRAELGWTGRIAQSPSRRFRDGSQGDLVRFGEVLLERRADGETTVERSAVSGLGVELRTFESREILAISQLDPIVGEPLWADLMMALWPALSPRVPELEPGDTRRQRTGLPFMLDSGMGAPLAMDLSWSLEGPVPCAEGSCWHFTYQGPVSGRGADRSDQWHARYQLEGNASGDLLLHTADNSISHSALELELTWTASIADPASGRARGRAVQRQQQRCSLQPTGGGV